MNDKLSNNALRAIVKMMEEAGMLGYGSIIDGDSFREMIHVKYPETGTKAEYDRLELMELSRVDFIRGELLKKGRFLLRENGNYRIALPSEHAQIIDRYLESANRKINRARLLGKNSPPSAEGIDERIVRAEMMRSQRKRGEIT
jgi:hypothetical protein